MRCGHLASVHVILRCSNDDSGSPEASPSDLDGMYALHKEASRAAVEMCRGDMLRALIFQGRRPASVARLYREWLVDDHTETDDAQARRAPREAGRGGPGHRAACPAAALQSLLLSSQRARTVTSLRRVVLSSPQALRECLMLAVKSG